MLRIANASCLFVAFCACACNGVAFGNGERATETRTLTDFDRVDSAGSMDVSIEQGDAFAVTVSIDSNLLPLLRTRVVGDTLRIDSEPDFERMVSGPHVHVTLPDFRAAALSGSGELSILAPQSGEAVDLNLSGSGSLSFDGAATETTVRLSGSGDVSLTGSSERVDLSLDGSGDIDAVELPATEGALQLSGSGSIRANLSTSVEVDLSGSGDVYLYGAAEVRRRSIAGSGELHRQ
jgi:hypothetical protein